MTDRETPLTAETADSSASEEREVTETLLPSGTEGTGLTPDVRQKLDEQIAATSGGVAAVRADVQQRLDQLDAMDIPEEGPRRTQMQADRAFYVAQLSYLEHVADPESKV